MRIRNALLAMTSMVALPSLAMASTITGPYIEGAGGYNLVQHQSIRTGSAGDTSRGASDIGKAHFGSGYNGYFSAGYGFGNGLRAELEGNYNQTNITRLGGAYTADGNKKAHGKDQGYGMFANVLYDIDLSKFGINVPVTPFVGLGAGYMWQNYRHVRNSNGYPGLNGTKGSFAAQGILGAAYDIPGVRGLALTAQYRFIGQVGSSSGVSLGRMHGTDGDRVDVGTRYTHQFLFGLRYAFNSKAKQQEAAPVAPVVAPPPVQVARTYLVFFDWAQANLTERGRAVVAQAVQASAHVQTTRIEVNGYADNSAIRPGEYGAKFNHALSVRRANSVKAELIRLGIPAAAIDIHGYGVNNPSVPTPHNTREPQNRRVEIILK